MSHYTVIRVYYEDTDLTGVVYHANYLKFFERGRTELLRAMGFELLNLLSTHNIHFVVHSIKLEYLQPARLDQVLYVRTVLGSLGKASLSFDQALLLQNESGPVLCRANIRLACLDRSFRPQKLPEFVSREIIK